MREQGQDDQLFGPRNVSVADVRLRARESPVPGTGKFLTHIQITNLFDRGSEVPF